MIAFASYGMFIFLYTTQMPWAWSLRVGSVLFLLWLAWPELSRIPVWVFRATIPTIVVIAIYPPVLYIVIPGIIAYLYLMPKK